MIIEISEESFENLLDRLADKLAERYVQIQPESLPDNTLLTVEEAADCIKSSKEKIYRLTRSGEVPSFSNGRRTMIYKRDLDKWIENGGSA